MKLWNGSEHATKIKRRKSMLRVLSVVLVLFMTCPSWSCAQTKNGFDVSNATIPPEKMISGGPPRDGIPSIDNPKYIPASEVTFLDDSDVLLGLVRNDKARAYPLRILTWHEIVNDDFDGMPVLVTYCPRIPVPQGRRGTGPERMPACSASGIRCLASPGWTISTSNLVLSTASASVRSAPAWIKKNC